MKITISGSSASGKSSVAKILAKKLNYKHYSMGDLQRKLAKEHNVDIVTWGKMEKEDPKYDHMIDQKQTDIGNNEDNFVMDGWLCAKFIPQAINIFIDAEVIVRAKRRLSHHRDEEKYNDIKIVETEILRREQINKDRWLNFYNFDYTDKNHYDLIIDTSQIPIEEVVQKIIEYLNRNQL